LRSLVKVLIVALRPSIEERACIEAFQATGVDPPQMTRRLGRVPSAIYRELRRNCFDNGGYDASVAQCCADLRARRPKMPKLAADPGLAEMMHQSL